MPTGSNRKSVTEVPSALQALPNDVPLVERAIKQEVAAAAGSGDLAADRAGFARLFVELIDARRA